jgi:integrase
VVGRSWIASWYGPDGRRIQRKVGPARSEARADGLTKAQAERVFRRMRELESPRPAPDGQRVTMEEAGREFCQRLELKGRRKSHRLTVASDLRNHIAPFFASKTLDRIGPEDIERYVAAKRRTLAIKTIRNHVNTMHSIFDLGLRKGWCQANPVKLADRPTVKKTETRIQFLDQAELEQLLAAPYPDDAFGRIEPTLYLTAAMTGLRQGELLGLRWRDVDFDARNIRVVSPYVRGEFGDPKSVGSGRSVPMAERVAVALRELRDRSVYSHYRDLSSAIPRRASRSTARSWSAASRTRSTAPGSTRSHSTSCAIRSAPGWRPPAHRCERFSTGWAHADSKTTQIYAHYQPSDQEADAVDRAFA